ncbi:RNA helicase Mov10l1 isoform X4 [Brienomyrus brachyistius]|uniref:RNA helicase Mov10l1 isoform X4 n=1 Tax=Brienomyrus brachyistius TaxID=42636 RepID=UPI0020B312A2|nr:RNA helicase Mov10l1 isoform X4 [Brienomyrus brachyistius]
MIGNCQTNRSKLHQGQKKAGDMMMMSTVQSVIVRLLSPLWRATEEDQDAAFYGAAPETVRDVREGVVTQLLQDYGLIDETVYFTDAQVLGGCPLHVGDHVSAIAVRDGAHGGWRALRVERLTSTWEDEGGAGLQPENGGLKHLIGTVTSCDQDGGFINQNTFFPRQALCQGYKPMKGDWVQAQYFISATQWSSQACSVGPLRYRRMDQYAPQLGDLVNVVVLESSQSFYCWRALCMAPVHYSPDLGRSVSDMDIQGLLENKGGLLVDEVQFGSLPLGGAQELLVYIENRGTEVHTLCRCELAGWDPQEQFTLGPVAPSISSSGKATKQRASMIQAVYMGIPFGSRMMGLHFSIMGSVGDSIPEADEDGVGEGGAKEASIREKQEDLEISPGAKVSITVSCRARNLGRCSELLLLHFPAFTIGRCLDITVSGGLETLLQPAAPYCPPTSSLARKTDTQVVTVQADPPARLSRRRLPNFLGSYPVPKALRDCLEAKGDVLLVQPLLAEPLSPASLQPSFSTLLWLEELQAEHELQVFSLTGALLRRGTAHLHLEVPGIAEGRPSVFVGDKVLLKKPLSGGIVVEYVAYVIEIKQEDLTLRVNSEFHHSYMGEPLDVEFTFNRLTMRRCHCAIDQAQFFEKNVLFPSTLSLQPPRCVGPWDQELTGEPDGAQEMNDVSKTGWSVQSLCVDMVSVATQTKTDSSVQHTEAPNPGCFFNPDLNPAQREAVKRILAAECRPIPYILFGPPGTGKTVTLVEAILQVHHRLPGSRVLVCTPSNTAADLICLRLHNSGFLHMGSLVRVNATCRQEESTPEVLWQYCRAGEDIRQASFHRIVVSTCSSAGMFYQINLHVGHFTHMFIDEAGQATEPETLIPLGLLSESEGQIVLAGDPHQLGPVVKSQQADTFGLGVSLLQRLMKRSLYSRGKNGYNPLLVTKLVYNYRSHEALLALPSRLFYSGELAARADRAVVDALSNWGHLPTKGFPIIFHGLRGKEMREGSNPSWFNPTEAVQVMFYCCQLAKSLYKPVAAADIGIITPYKKQVETIRTLLHRVGLADVKVGSVEQFQGQESLVVILSTVRCNEALVAEDVHSVLGFLSNPKRFNVAITRAKALLIIVGNPHVLIKDPCFCALLQYCRNNGAFLGCDPPPCLRLSQRTAAGKPPPQEESRAKLFNTVTCAK